MRSSSSGLYRGKDGQERLWFSATDIENMMEDELRRFNCFPAAGTPTVDVERFIQCLGVRMDQYADLDASVLGLTEFFSDQPPRILINRDLTGAIDNDETPPGIRGRWRATMAHEASHVVMHRILFEQKQNQQALFQTQGDIPAKQLMRCLKRSVLFRGGGSGDWREVQANMGMAELLMPQSIFRQIARNLIQQHSFAPDVLSIGSNAAGVLTGELAALFDVSKQAAGIRLESLGLLSAAQQNWLLHELQ
jgi:hypothetical protein